MIFIKPLSSVSAVQDFKPLIKLEGAERLIR